MFTVIHLQLRPKEHGKSRNVKHGRAIILIFLYKNLVKWHNSPLKTGSHAMRMNICVTMCFVQWMIGCIDYLYNINIILIIMCRNST